MKNDLNLRLMLAKELPELINLLTSAAGTPIFVWKETNASITDREWDWVVRECEKKLTPAQRMVYTEMLAADIRVIDYGYYPGEECPDWDAISTLVFITWQQRAEAFLLTLAKKL